MKVAAKVNHFGIYVHDLDRMSDFYTRALGLVVTDHGDAKSTGSGVVFLSGDPTAHHQIVLIQYPDGHPRGPSTVNQISFKTDSIAELRALHAQVERMEVAPMRPMNHGTSISIYTKDPEGNGIELYTDMPWYISQPFGDPLDMSQSDEAILAETERKVRADPSFQTRAEWSAGLKKRIEQERAM